MPESAIAETASPEESGGTEAPRTETFRHTGQGMFYDSDLSPYYTPYTFLNHPCGGRQCGGRVPGILIRNAPACFLYQLVYVSVLYSGKSRGRHPRVPALEKRGEAFMKPIFSSGLRQASRGGGFWLGAALVPLLLLCPRRTSCGKRSASRRGRRRGLPSGSSWTAERGQPGLLPAG